MHYLQLGRDTTNNYTNYNSAEALQMMTLYITYSSAETVRTATLIPHIQLGRGAMNDCAHITPLTWPRRYERLLMPHLQLSQGTHTSLQLGRGATNDHTRTSLHLGRGATNDYIHTPPSTRPRRYERLSICHLHLGRDDVSDYTHTTSAARPRRYERP